MKRLVGICHSGYETNRLGTKLELYYSRVLFLCRVVLGVLINGIKSDDKMLFNEIGKNNSIRICSESDIALGSTKSAILSNELTEGTDKYSAWQFIQYKSGLKTDTKLLYRWVKKPF